MTPIASLRQLIKQQKLDATLISSVPNITYLTNYAGFSPFERDAYVFVTQKNAYLFTSPLYVHEMKHIPAEFLVKEISLSSPLPKQLSEIVKNENIVSVGIESDHLTIKEYKLFKPYLHVLKHVNLQDLRMMKSNKEIDAIKRACKLGDQAFTTITKALTPGITEKELAFELELFIRERGAEISFPTIVAFGKNSAIPHHKTDNTKLKTNDVILIDFGVKIDSYCSDMTRTFFIGAPTPEQQKVYKTVLAAQQKAVKFIEEKLYYSSSKDRSSEDKNSHIRSNNIVSATEVDNEAREYIVSQGYASIPHSVGHGIGIEVHEPPRLSPKSNDELMEGMVFSLEPGIYLPGKFGVRIEDLFIITDDKLITLTKAPIASPSYNNS